MPLVKMPNFFLIFYKPRLFWLSLILLWQNKIVVTHELTNELTKLALVLWAPFENWNFMSSFSGLIVNNYDLMELQTQFLVNES